MREHQNLIERLRGATKLAAELAEKKPCALALFKRLYMELLEAEAAADPVKRALAKLERQKMA